MTLEEIDGICEIWTTLPNPRPGLKLPVRVALTPEQVEEVKGILIRNMVDTDMAHSIKEQQP